MGTGLQASQQTVLISDYKRRRDKLKTKQHKQVFSCREVATVLVLLGYSPGDRDNNPAAIVCYLAIKRWRPLLAILPLYSPCCFSSNAQETFFSTRGICLLHRIIWATPALHSLLKMRGAGHGDKEWRHPSYSAIKAAWCSSTVIRWFVRNNRGGMTGGLGSRQGEY